MARQGGRVQLEHADMRIALNMVHMATHGISRSGIEETTHLIKKPRAEKRRRVEFPGHRSLKVVIGKHPAMMYENQSDGCLPCHHDSIGNPSTRWKRKGTGPAQRQLRRQTGSAQTRLVPTRPLPAAQCDVPPPQINVPTGLPRVFDPLGDDDDEEDDDNFTDEHSEDSQDEELTGMCVFPQHMI
jgi:hypothetical protein